MNPSAVGKDYFGAYAAGIPGKIRVIYFPRPILPWGKPAFVRGLEPNVRYEATLFDPKDGSERPLGPVATSARGEWQVPPPPIMKDWVLLLQRAGD